MEENKMKPVKKGIVTELNNTKKVSALAAFLLAGSIAFSATGCTIELKGDLPSVELGGKSESVEENDEDEEITVMTDEIVSEASSEMPIAQPVSTWVGSGEDPMLTYPSDNAQSGATQPTTEYLGYMEDDNFKYTELFTNLSDGTAMQFDSYGDGLELKGACDATLLIYYPYSQNYQDPSVTITISFLDWDLPVSGGHYLTDAYLLKTDGRIFIYLEACQAGKIALNVYEITDDGIVYVGRDDDLILSTVKDPKQFWCYDNCGLGGLEIERYYKVSNTGMPVPANNEANIYAVQQITTKALTGYVVENGKATSQQMTFEEGELVTPVFVNEVEYFELKNMKGDTIRVDFEDALNQYYDQNDFRWVYRAIMSMIEPAGIRALGPIQEGSAYTFQVCDSCYFIDASFGYFRIYRGTMGTNEMTFDINGKMFDVPVDIEGGYIGAYLVKHNGILYIYVHTLKNNGSAMINVYELKDHSAPRVGVEDGLFICGMNEADRFWCQENYEENGKLWICRYYKVGDSGMPIPADNYCQVSVQYEFSAIAAKELTGYIVKDGQVTSEQITVAAGEVVIPIEVCEVEYFEMQTEDGTVFRVDFTEALNEYYDMNDYRWVTRAIMSFIEIV